MQNARLGIEALERPGPARRVLDDRGRPGFGQERLDQIVKQHLGPGGVGLDHKRIAEPVDHHTGQAVSLGMDQAVERRVVQAVAQRQRPRDAGAEPVHPDRRGGVAIEHPGKELRGRVDRHKADVAARIVLQHRQRAGGKRAGAAVGHDLVVIDPGEAVADGLGGGLGVQANHREI